MTEKSALLEEIAKRMENLQRAADKAITQYVEQHDARELARYNDCISRKKAFKEAYDLVYWRI